MVNGLIFVINIKKRGQMGTALLYIEYRGRCGSLLYIEVLNLNPIIGTYHCIRKIILNGDDLSAYIFSSEW